jgi:hypothetical protein
MANATDNLVYRNQKQRPPLDRIVRYRVQSEHHAELSLCPPPGHPKPSCEKLRKRFILVLSAHSCTVEVIAADQNSP